MAAKDGDIVMDFFSGSATTAHAVMQTEADKNIDLHYILVQIPQECDQKKVKRIRQDIRQSVRSEKNGSAGQQKK